MLECFVWDQYSSSGHSLAEHLLQKVWKIPEERPRLHQIQCWDLRNDEREDLRCELAYNVHQRDGLPYFISQWRLRFCLSQHQLWSKQSHLVFCISRAKSHCLGGLPKDRRSESCWLRTLVLVQPGLFGETRCHRNKVSSGCWRYRSHQSRVGTSGYFAWPNDRCGLQCRDSLLAPAQLYHAEGVVNDLEEEKHPDSLNSLEMAP